MCRVSGTEKKNHKIFFLKMFFISRVQSIGNYLICLDPKSYIFIFFSKKLWNFFVLRVRDFEKKITKYFFWKMVFKSRVQSIRNCMIRLDPKSCNLTFKKKTWTVLKFTVGHILKESLNIFLEFFQHDMVQTNAHNF